MLPLVPPHDASQVHTSTLWSLCSEQNAPSLCIIAASSVPLVPGSTPVKGAQEPVFSGEILQIHDYAHTSPWCCHLSHAMMHHKHIQAHHDVYVYVLNKMVPPDVCIISASFTSLLSGLTPVKGAQEPVVNGEIMQSNTTKKISNHSTQLFISRVRLLWAISRKPTQDTNAMQTHNRSLLTESGRGASYVECLH